MLRTTSILMIAAAAVSTILPSVASARPVHRFAIFDNDGKKLFDDGRLDGKACVVGKRAFFNPVTGKFVVVPAAKCNF